MELKSLRISPKLTFLPARPKSVTVEVLDPMDWPLAFRSRLKALRIGLVE
jgi:hypothetical protein